MNPYQTSQSKKKYEYKLQCKDMFLNKRSDLFILKQILKKLNNYGDKNFLSN